MQLFEIQIHQLVAVAYLAWLHFIHIILPCHSTQRTGGDHQDTLVLRGWRLSNRTWNPTTSPWMKQLMRLRIVHSGDWCLRLALRSPSGACYEWINERVDLAANVFGYRVFSPMFFLLLRGWTCRVVRCVVVGSWWSWIVNIINNYCYDNTNCYCYNTNSLNKCRPLALKNQTWMVGPYEFNVYMVGHPSYWYNNFAKLCHNMIIFGIKMHTRISHHQYSL